MIDEFERTEHLSDGLREYLKEDLRITILGCFRYSLGRRTYMPQHIVNVIIRHYAIFTAQDWKLFIKEIDECNDLGNTCDINTWQELKTFAQEQLK